MKIQSPERSCRNIIESPRDPNRLDRVSTPCGSTPRQRTGLRRLLFSVALVLASLASGARGQEDGHAGRTGAATDPVQRGRVDSGQDAGQGSGGGSIPADRKVVPEDWLASAERRIAESEYEITWQNATVFVDLDAAYQAPNRAHGLRTYFTPGGIRVVPRTQASPSWEWSLALLRIVRTGASAPRSSLPGDGAANVAPLAAGAVGAADAIEPAVLHPDGNRIEYERGEILEWYVNDEKGLEQGFTLRTRPPARADRDSPNRVVIELALGGTLSAYPSEDGQSIEFRTPAGAGAIHYRGLRVTDASGRDLPARMEAFVDERMRGVRLVFEDDDARYPVTVDPLATSYAWTGESNQIGAEFGVSVATAGDVNGDGYSDVIVGADRYDLTFTDRGRVDVFLGSMNGLSATAIWTNHGNSNFGGAGARFGQWVGTAGDVNGDGYSDVIVGSPAGDSGNPNVVDTGFAEVFHGSASGQLGAFGSLPNWASGGDRQANAYFGTSVGTAGDVNGDGYSDVIVGAYAYDNGQIDKGKAYVYHGAATGLSTAPAWTAESDQAGAEFGFPVATAGDVNGDGYADVIVGAAKYDFSGATPDSGRVYVHHGSALGLSVSASWSLVASTQSEGFGVSVGTAGDFNGDGFSDIIVGAWNHASGAGRFQVRHGSPTGVSNVQVYGLSGGQSGAHLGVSAATAGDVNGDGYSDVIVGAYQYDNTLQDEGRAQIYLGSPTGSISASPGWTVDGGQLMGNFGYVVATAGDVNGDGYSDFLVGAPAYDNGQNDEGLAFLYLGSPSGPAATAGSAVEINQGGAQLGTSVEGAGDVNGDGYSDVIVGAPLFDNGQTDEGAAFVHFGSASGLSSAAAWTDEGNQTAAHFGEVVGRAGDVNGDGYADVVIGAPLYDNGQTDEGRAFIYLGSPVGPGTSPAWMAESGEPDARFGAAAGTAGDVNGDGYSDVIVGAPLDDNGSVDEGLAYVYLGSVVGPGASPAWTADGNQNTARFGSAVGTAGDVNRDGFSDVIVGAPLYDNGQTDEGRAFAYHGSATGLAASPAWFSENDQVGARFGAAVASAGDVNGDGYSDVIVGSDRYDGGQTDEGRAAVFGGSASGILPSSLWTSESNQVSAFHGASVGTAGDVNGDGYSDVVVGAPAYDVTETDEGGAFVYLGSATGPGAIAVQAFQGAAANANLGAAVGMAGDVNGDGYADVIVGAPLRTNGQTGEGLAFLHYGNGGRGVRLKPEQRRTTDVAPIAPLGASDSLDAFRLSLLGRTPFGRGRVRLEWEVKPLGTPLNGTGTMVEAADTDTGVVGASLDALATGLAIDTSYHWRVRLRYKTATTPFAQRSRWLSMPSNGSQEADLRTSAVTAGRVPGAAPDQPLSVTKAAAPNITLTWDASCNPSDTDHAIYEGILGQFYSHVPKVCTTAGATTRTLTPAGGNRYYLVVPFGPMREGSYGTRSDGTERPSASGACRRQAIGVCP